MDMLGYFILLVMCAIAIENLSDILVTVPWLEPLRKIFENDFSEIGTLARCKYCQMFWMSGLLAMFFPVVPFGGFPTIVSCFLVWLCSHKIAQWSDSLNKEHLVEIPEEHSDGQEESQEQEKESLGGDSVDPSFEDATRTADCTSERTP